MALRDQDFFTWREYQRDLSRKRRRKYFLKRLPWLGLCSGAGVLILAILFYSVAWLSANLEGRAWAPPKQTQPVTPTLSKMDLASILDQLSRDELTSSAFHNVEHNGLALEVELSIVPELQRYASNLLGRSMTHAAAVVVLRPETGEILAMAQTRDESLGEDLCLEAGFPAASLFKIVAAAAAIEARGFSPETELTFQGGKYTLYRNQLKQQSRGRYAVKTTLKDAFSDSINPVFGKLGIFDLGRDIMEDYAYRFLFDRPIPFELPLGVSHFDVPMDDFALAEIASGFNKRTLISPLHAALITSAVPNEGVIMEPWLVKTVKDASGHVLYQAEPKILVRAIENKTAHALRDLMSETVSGGTARGAFRPLQRKKTFRDFDFGAKTGSINDPTNQYRVDWLTAYALPAYKDGGVSVAVLAVHGEKLGVRAREIVRHIIAEYFRS